MATPTVRAKRPAGNAAKPAATTKPAAPAAKPATPKTGPAKVAAAKPAAKPTGNVDTSELATDEAKALAEKLAAKEVRKKAAFAKLKKMSEEKKAARAVQRTADMEALQGELEVGDHRFLIRASYYGCEVEVLGFEEIRGRNLVHVKVLTTKKGRELDEDKTYERKVSPKFLVEERPTEAYVKRRANNADVEDSEADEEAELEDDSLEAGGNAENLPETDNEEESDEEEAEDEDADSEDEDEEADEDSDDEDESDEDDESWGE